MTLKRNETDNVLFFECDECGDTVDTDHTDLVDAVQAFKSSGGLIQRANAPNRGQPAKWRHFCSDCKDCA